jgi:hypothetical protein
MHSHDILCKIGDGFCATRSEGRAGHLAPACRWSARTGAAGVLGGLGGEPVEAGIWRPHPLGVPLDAEDGAVKKFDRLGHAVGGPATHHQSGSSAQDDHDLESPGWSSREDSGGGVPTSVLPPPTTRQVFGFDTPHIGLNSLQYNALLQRSHRRPRFRAGVGRRRDTPEGVPGRPSLRVPELLRGLAVAGAAVASGQGHQRIAGVRPHRRRRHALLLGRRHAPDHGRRAADGRGQSARLAGQSPLCTSNDDRAFALTKGTAPKAPDGRRTKCW